MTVEEIKEIIEKDEQAINNAPFPEKLPPWLLDNFDKVIMKMPQAYNPYTAATLKSVLSKKHDVQELTVVEGGWVLNCLNNIEPELIAKDIHDFMRKKEIIGQIMYNYNMGIAKEKIKLEKKKDVLLKGLRNQPKIVSIN